ncbi:MAG: response regulator [Deltaproteobacteria bacterium]|nr:response regulator [Deltaproteobacteria bacterium]
MRELNFIVVDDDPGWVHWVKFYLFKTFKPPEYRLEIKTASHGSDALMLLEQATENGRPPDLVLSDTNMPRMDGLELWNSFLKNYKKSIPFVLLFSGWGENPKFTKDDVRALGIEHILTKEEAEINLGSLISKILIT